MLKRQLVQLPSPSFKLGEMDGATVEAASVAIVDADVGGTVVGVSFPSL